MTGHGKRVIGFHEPGDCHELTFSCYRRMPLLTNDAWPVKFCEVIDRAIKGHSFRQVAFVLMPEHVHLLGYPSVSEPDLDKLLFAVKRPYSYRIKQLLIENDSELLRRLTIRERPGKTTFRYWQEGPGYDRNFAGKRATFSTIDYKMAVPYFRARRQVCVYDLPASRRKERHRAQTSPGEMRNRKMTYRNSPSSRRRQLVHLPATTDVCSHFGHVEP
jgi:putative transposase